jgi:hypothetical protein
MKYFGVANFILVIKLKEIGKTRNFGLIRRNIP